MIISTQFIDLDTMLLGMRKKILNDHKEILNGGINIPSFIILGARTGMGKTAFLLNLALNISQKSDVKICYVSLDQNFERLTERVSSIIEFDSDAKEYFDNIDIMDKYCKFDELVEFIHHKCKEDNVKIFIIDYIQLFNNAHENLYEESSYIAITLKNICTKLGVCIIVASQLTRSVENRPGYRPRLTDLRDSGALEESADQVLLLLRRDYYDPNDKPGQAELIIAKNRFGNLGCITLTYVKDHNVFANYLPSYNLKDIEDQEDVFKLK